MNVAFRKKSQIAFAVSTAISAGAALTAPVVATAADNVSGKYVAGDFHNHTTCSDGTISLQKLVKKATDTTETPFGLDWFVQAGHGGNGNRNCTLVEDASLSPPAYPFTATPGPNTTWEAFCGTPQGDGSGPSPDPEKWGWQTGQEVPDPGIRELP